MSKLVILRSYPDRLHAELARGYLESEGIDSFVTSPSNLPGSFLIAEWGDGLIPHEVKVAEEDLHAAEQALADTESGVEGEDWYGEKEPGGEETRDVTAADGSVAYAPAWTSSQEVDSGVCSTCHRDKHEDDPGYSKLRFRIMVGFVVYFVIVVTVPFLSGHTVDWLLLMGTVLFGAFLVARMYLTRHRCGGCGRYRTER